MDFYEPRANEWEADLAQLKRRLLGALGFILLVTLAGIIGFSVIDPDAGLIRAFYMTAITLTTVGYGEVIAIDSDGARIFTAVIILVGMGATLYFVSTGTAFLLEGQLGHVFRRKKMERDLTMISGHTIVCGTGPTAMYAASEIAATGRSIVLVGASAAEIEESVVDLPTIPVVIGDMTDDDILLAAGIDRADGLLACSESDNENVVVTLSARQLNPGLRIVSRLTDVQQELKIRRDLPGHHAPRHRQRAPHGRSRRSLGSPDRGEDDCRSEARRLPRGPDRGGAAGRWRVDLQSAPDRQAARRHVPGVHGLTGRVRSAAGQGARIPVRHGRLRTVTPSPHARLG